MSYNSRKVIQYYQSIERFGLFRYEAILIDKYFKPFGRTLDIGCGTGRTTIPLNNAGFDTIGIDYSKGMISSAKSRHPEINYQIANVLATPFANDEFDNILFSFNGLMLIETYEKRLSAVKEICRILSDSGTFVFCTPFLDNKTNSDYWSQKARKLNISIENASFEELIKLGNENLTDCGRNFFIHVPFINEISQMISDANMKTIFSARRLDYSGLEVAEDELDDNYLWVAKKK